jgi:large subunit ribosomal protein L4
VAATKTVKAPVLDGSGKKAKDLSLEAAVFGADVKQHLVHETVRAEMNARRAGTRAAKSRGLVAGGRSKPWRQKGTGRARAGTTRAPHWTGGGLAFPPTPRSFSQKVNRKARKAALRAALSAHASDGSLGVVGNDAFAEPSTKSAVELLGEWGKELPLLAVFDPEQAAMIKSFRNLDGVYVVGPSEVEVTEIVWARSLLVSEQALEALQGRAQ